MKLSFCCTGGRTAIAMLFCLATLVATAQTAGQHRISGTVLDAVDGTPLIGANILVKNTPSIGTVTDVDGKFSLDVPNANSVLVFSYTGYATYEEPIGGRSQMEVKLSSGMAELEEVVVIGYGSQKKRDVTAAISSVSGEDITKIAVASTAQALQGQVAGLDVQATGGRPGQYPSVRIRGRRSISASNQPLYVVDGIPLTDEGTAFDLNPQDILSVEVLKDAAATAIYGSRGANGVILISTRRGSEGKPTVSYDAYYGVSRVTQMVDMMNGEEFTNLKRESRRQGFNGAIPPDEQVFTDPVELESIRLGRYTDYQSLVLDEGHQQNHQFSIRGGSNSTQYMLSANFFEEQGIIPTQDYQRYSLRINLDQQVSSWLKVGTSSYISRAVQNWASNPMGEALSNNPLGVPYDAEGNLLFLPTNDGIRTNPLNEIVPGAHIDERRFHSILASVYAQADILEGLQFRTTFGPEIRFRRRGEFTGSLTNARRGAPPQAFKDENSVFTYTLENLLTYNKTLGSDHRVTATVLQSIQEFDSDNTSIRVSKLPYESQEFNNLSTAEEVLGFDSGLSEWQLASFMGRLSYDFKGRYLLQVSARADGSSRLAPGNKWAVFPGVSLGWRIAEEAFMQNLNFFDDLKLRASYGEVGNTSINPYQTQGALRRSTYVFGNSAAFGYGLNDIPNPNLTWETTSTIDVGVDFSLFNGRISGSVDYYISETNDLLLRRQLPPTSGYTSILENVGSTRNTGWEVFLETVNFDTPNGFRWTTSANFFSNREEITSLFNSTDDDIGNRWFIGQPIGVFYDFRKIGIWQLNEVDEAAKFGDRPGDIKLEDVNGDGKYGPDDRVILGTDIPDFTIGFTNTFQYKNFDFSVFFYSRFGHTVFSGFHTGNNTLQGRYNNLDVDYWTPNNPTNAYPKPIQNQERPKYDSTLGYFDGTYIKLRNATLGYTLPNTLTERIRMRNLRLYVSAQNPWFWSKFDTYDPEVGQNNDSNRQETVDGDVPSARLFLIGLSAGF